MSEDPRRPARRSRVPEPPSPSRSGPAWTSVDAVIAAVEELEERPIEEHVGVFETAHEQLRRARWTASPGRAAADRSQPS